MVRRNETFMGERSEKVLIIPRKLFQNLSAHTRLNALTGKKDQSLRRLTEKRSNAKGKFLNDAHKAEGRNDKSNPKV